MPWQRRPLVSITLKITHDEPVLLDAPGETCFPPLWGSVGILRSSLQSRGDCGRKTARRSTDAEQIGSSRLGAPRARNFYDLWYLSQQREQVDWTKVSSILPRKSAVRGVSITSLADVFQPTLISDVRASWTGTLGQFISELPEVDRGLAELQSHLNQLLKL